MFLVHNELFSMEMCWSKGQLIVIVSSETDFSHLHDVLLAQLFLDETEEWDFSEGGWEAQSRVAYGP